MSDGTSRNEETLDLPRLEAEVAARFRLRDLAMIVEGGQKKRVYSARRGPIEVILKLLPLGDNDATMLERARREVDALGRINHRNVVRLIEDLIEVERGSVIAVAWLEERLHGTDLWTRVDEPWQPEEAIRLGLDVARGLGALHAEQVVHRDLSPGNVFACNDGRYVILDPGYGKHLDRSSLSGISWFGTAGFLSPEHPRQRTRPFSDVFALGILLHLVLTGELPFDPYSDHYYLDLCEGQAPSVAELRSSLDARLVAIVDKCLHRQPARRFLHGDELAEAFEAL